MGVRISWLMLARNSLLARLAASAASLLSRNSLSTRSSSATVRDSSSARCARAWATRRSSSISSRRRSASQRRFSSARARSCSRRSASRSCSRLPLHLLGLLEEVDEHGDLGLEDLGHDRLGQEVDRADGIAAEDLGVAAVEGRQEDDRGVLRAVAPADQRRGLEPVHARHLDVEQDDGEVPVEQPLQRLGAGLGPDQVLAEVGEDGLQGEEVLRAIVDHEDVDLVIIRHGSAPTPRGRGRPGAARSATTAGRGRRGRPPGRRRGGSGSRPSRAPGRRPGRHAP